MKQLVFDAGPLISLATSNLLNIIEFLKKKFDVEFIIPESVKLELVDKALQTRRFKHEALDILYLVSKEILKIEKSDDLTIVKNLIMDIANHLYYVDNNPIKILHSGEAEVFAVMKKENITHAVIDEISAKLLFENPKALRDRLEQKLHEHVRVDKEKLDLLKEKFSGFKFFRSSELVVIAFENGAFEKYQNIDYKKHSNIVNINAETLEALLWQLKLNGCAITAEEIYQIMKIEHEKGFF